MYDAHDRMGGLTAPGLKRLQQQHASFLLVEEGVEGDCIYVLM